MDKLFSIFTNDKMLLSLKCCLGLCLVNFTDNFLVLISDILNIVNLSSLKDLVNLLVSLLIGAYWIVKITVEKRKIK
jgi:hypothetical protein